MNADRVVSCADMLEELSNKDIAVALDEVIACVGVREEMPYRDLLVLLRKNDPQGCAQEIAARLRLPIHINLSFVKPGSADGFRTTALAQISRVSHGIAATVEMPQHLPMFGTSGLQGYPIRVRVTENCYQHPKTFVAILVHELSHLLLASLYHPKKDSELHTDLVPIALGFRDVVRRGRKAIRSNTSGNLISTQTTTYGYLTDSQFDYACDYVRAILKRHQQAKDRLAELIAQLQRKLHAATRKLAAFHHYLEYLDAHPTGKMKEEDARRAVQCHTGGYCRDWESGIASARAAIENAEESTRPLNRYTSSEVGQMQEHTSTIELATQALDSVGASIAQDLRTLRRYVPLSHQLRGWVVRRQARDGVVKTE